MNKRGSDKYNPFREWGRAFLGQKITSQFLDSAPRQAGRPARQLSVVMKSINARFGTIRYYVSAVRNWKLRLPHSREPKGASWQA